MSLVKWVWFQLPFGHFALYWAGQWTDTPTFILLCSLISNVVRSDIAHKCEQCRFAVLARQPFFGILESIYCCVSLSLTNQSSSYFTTYSTWRLKTWRAEKKGPSFACDWLWHGTQVAISDHPCCPWCSEINIMCHLELVFSWIVKIPYNLNKFCLKWNLYFLVVVGLYKENQIISCIVSKPGPPCCFIRDLHSIAEPQAE